MATFAEQRVFVAQPAEYFVASVNLSQISGPDVPTLHRQEAARAGDQRYTFADTTKIRSHLGWSPRTNLEEGLVRQWEWQESVV